MHLKHCFLTSVALAAAVVGAGPVLADFELGIPAGATRFSRDIHDLHVAVVLVCAVIALIVYGAMVFAMIRFRKSAGAKPAGFSHSALAEVIWTVIPAVILLGLAIPAADTLMRTANRQQADVTIEVTGHRWRWHFGYVGRDIAFFSTDDEGGGFDPDKDPFEVDRAMVVPVDSTVRLLLTSADVLHSLWIPDLGVNRLAVPESVAEVWFETEQLGSYRGQCDALCGMGRGFMPVVVEVVSADDYQYWLSER